MAPGIDPMPPRMTIASTPMDSMKVNDSGLMKTCLAEKRTPTAPAKDAPHAKAELHAHQRHAHRLRRRLILPDGLPGAADVRILEAAVDEHGDADDGEHEEVEVQRIDHVGVRVDADRAEDGLEEDGRARDRGDALRAVREVDGLVEVVGEDADHLAEAQCHDGEVVAVQPQHGQAEQDAGARRHRHPEEQEQEEPAWAREDPAGKN